MIKLLILNCNHEHQWQAGRRGEKITVATFAVTAKPPTKMMRLLAEYETQIPEYARLLDSEGNSGALTFKDELKQQIDTVLLTLKPSERRSTMQLFKKLLSQR